MTEVMDIKRAHEVGLKGYHKMALIPCQYCGTPRWTPANRPSQGCIPCTNKRIRGPRPEQGERQRGAGNHLWKGGVVRGGNGYLYERVYPEDPMFPMANKHGYAMQHRIVMARHLGRPLERWEQVHHVNGKRTENGIENLELWKHSQPSGIRQSDYHCPGCTCAITAPKGAPIGY